MRNELKKLEDMILANDSDLMMHLIDLLAILEYNIETDRDNYILGVPRYPKNQVLLSAHIDTLVYDRDSMQLTTNGNIITNDFGVLGGDDRAGVFIVAQLISLLERKPYVCFFNYEENRSTGARNFCSKKFLDSHIENINLFIGYDRRGFRQYVSYHDVDPELANILDSYGYVRQSGTTSDVRILTNAYGVANINLNAGFFNEHSHDEYVDMDAITKTIELGLEILPKIKNKYRIK